MKRYNVEIKVTLSYDVEDITAKNEDDAKRKAFVLWEKDKNQYFCDSDAVATADEVEEE